MNPNQIRALVTLGLCLALASFLGYVVAAGNYEIIIYLIYVALGIFMIVAPGYTGLIALGLVCPFGPPTPFIYNVPFVALILGACITKYVLRRWIARRDPPAPQTNLPVSFYLFFAWVFVRYCLDPVAPNVRGFGENVSGFRAYLGYATCLTLVVFLRCFLRSRGDALAVVRWMGIFSLFFILLLVPLIFTKSGAIAEALMRFGLYVTVFDNGWLRFVVLPGFGSTLVALGLLPSLTNWSSGRRRLLVAVGMAAIIMGGNRGSFLMALLLILTIAYVRRGFGTVCVLAAPIVICMVVFGYIAENFRFDQGVGFFRILALTSRRVAEQSGADATISWRKVRWERAMEDIRARPVVGHGYGGLERAFVFGDMSQREAAAIDIGVATGGIHNGFISGTRALGVPGLVLFLCAFIGQLIFNWKHAVRYRTSDPAISDLHCFVFANLVGMTVGIYVGADLNSHHLWFYLGFGCLVAALRKRQVLSTEGSESRAEEVGLAPQQVPT
jgi:O-antigen ligase